MKKRVTFLSILTASVICITVLAYANSMQDQHQHDAHHPHPDQIERPMELNSVMRLLMLDVHSINEGIYTENFDLIATGAASIVDHPELADKTTRLLDETLGPQLGIFEEYDHRAHMYADSIRQAADDSDISRVLQYYRMMEQTCIACHGAFQDRLRLARLTSGD